MHKLLIIFLSLVIFFAQSGIASSIDSLPWIGDGRPELKGAAFYNIDPAPEFKAEFVLSKGLLDPKMIFVCAGFGFVRLENGVTLMDDTGLQTLWTPYDKTVYSHTLSARDKGYTFKPYPATNTIYAVLGNGFYNMLPLKFWGSKCFRNSLAHGRPCFKLWIEGVEKPLKWKWRETNILRNSVYLGTEIDMTRPKDLVWKNAAEVPGPRGKIIQWPTDNPQSGVKESATGKAYWHKKGQVQVVDFGVNTSSIPSFCFEGEEPGTRIEILYGERLNKDGSVNVLTQTAGQIKRPNMGGPGAPSVAAQRDVYVCGGGKEIFRPPFTWHIFRYAEIRGAKNLLASKAIKRDVISMVSLDENKSLGDTIQISNKDLQAIHEICRRTFQANLIGGVQSDCPGRERLGYGGDIVSTYEAYILNFDMREIYLKILKDFADEAKDGWITETAPYVGIKDSGFGKRAGPISWALAVPELIGALLKHYNEERALDYYPVCAKYIKLADKKCPSGIIPYCLGDHEAISRAPRNVTATAHWYRFVKLTEGFAKRLGKKDDEKKFGLIAEKIRGAFIKNFVKSDGTIADGTQSAQATGFYLGLVPENLRDAAFQKLVESVEKTNYAPTTGIFSTRYALMALSENGRVDIARKIVLHKGFPGWLYMIERGATTLWETWKESDNVYSNCHPMFGSVDEWIIKYGNK
jgi:alpha-L-rhamnosidase